MFYLVSERLNLKHKAISCILHVIFFKIFLKKKIKDTMYEAV